MLVHNGGAIPATERDGCGLLWSRGFNLVLLNEHGRPTHFCKCRPSEEGTLARETALLEWFGLDPVLTHIVPEVAGAQSQDFQLQLAAFVPGERGDLHLSRSTDAGLERDLSAIVRRCELFGERGQSAELLREESGTPLGNEAHRPIAYLRDVGILDMADTKLLERALEGISRVRPAFQHGDLWGRNLLRHRSTWRLLDFELYGTVRAPLYDVLHLLRTTSDLRSRGAGGDARAAWLSRLDGGDRTAHVSRRVLGEAIRRWALSAADARALAVYYFVDMSARIHRRAPPGYADLFVAEVHAAAATLRSGDEALLASTLS